MFLLSLFFFWGQLGPQDSLALSVKGKTGVIKLRLLKVVEEEYKLLTKKNPIDITCQGPIRLKILTRVLFPDTLQKKTSYSLIVESEEGEILYPFEAEISRTKDEQGRRFGLGRVINIDCPAGTHHFRCHLFSAPKETCAVKFTLERWRWEEVIPFFYKDEVSVLKSGERIRYYASPVKIKVKSGSYKILARLSYPGEEGENQERQTKGTPKRDTLRIIVKMAEKEIFTKEFLVERSPKVYGVWETEGGRHKTDVSIVKAAYLDLKEGEYEIVVQGGGEEDLIGVVKIQKRI